MKFLDGTELNDRSNGAMAQQIVRTACSMRCMQLLQSPIEYKMMLALLAVGGSAIDVRTPIEAFPFYEKVVKDARPLVDSFTFALLFAGTIAGDTLLTVQWPIESPGGVYRCDFALIPPEHTEVEPVCVECDGKRFHMPDAAVARDKKRDRWLAARGWKVARFTGSEIFEDPLRCAHEAISIVRPHIIGLDEVVARANEGDLLRENKTVSE